MCGTKKPRKEFRVFKQDGKKYTKRRCRECEAIQTLTHYHECKEDIQLKRAAKRKLQTTKDYHKNWNLKDRFGITLDEFNLMVESQGGGCWVCNSTNKLSVDHDHATGKIRGILCNSCNRSLGLLHDDIPRIRKLIDYLEK